ncbi:polysaccharide biosynthesis C-terminal domain-containing protein [Nocardioides pantholopis]|uniref:polysaccharide biosynthesis C-terminal domain-containing protein n=1 Tax=Nocardioides pantholopis TaxID=2483798 RepID=UPI000F08D5A0|nr:polysaccharide biosynthesis C-terminal domain-containing protein [Nocardioides pantholopis]
MDETAQLRGLARGGLGGLAGAGVSGLAGVAFVVVAARGLSAGEVGAVFALTSLFLVTLAVVELGSDVALVRFLALRLGQGDPAGAAAAAVVLLGPVLLLATLAGALLAVVGPGLAVAVVDVPGVSTAALVLALLVPVAAASDLMLAATRGLGTVRPTIVVDGLVRQGSQPVLALLALAVADGAAVGPGAGVVWVVAAWGAPYVVSCLLAARALRRLAHAHRLPSALGPRTALLTAAAEVWRFTAPRSLTQVAQTAIRRADIPLVAALAGPAAAAVYTAASRIVALGQLGIKGIQQMVGPQMARLLGAGHREAAVLTLRSATTWSVTIAWPVYLACLAVPEAVLAVFGSGYTGATTVVVVLAAAMLVGTAAGPVDTALLMTGRSVASLLNNLAALATNLVLNVLLIPRWGAEGAAVAWAASIVVSNALPTWQVRAELGGTPADRRTLTAIALPALSLGLPAAIAWSLGAPPAVRGGLLVAGLVVHALLLLRFRDVLRLPELLGAVRGGRGGRGGAREPRPALSRAGRRGPVSR